MSPLQHLVAGLIVLVGAAIQGALGFGANLFAAPLLALVDSSLVPGPVIVSSAALNLLLIRREPGAHVWREIRWPAVASACGSVVGALVVASLGAKALTVVFAALVLTAVALSVVGLHPRRTPRNLLIAGSASGLMGTISGIGGPPMALLYQHATGREIRGALARLFAVGSCVSLFLLTVVGEFGWSELVAGLWLLPGTFIGYLVSGRLLAHVDRGHVRVAVLVLSSAAAIAAIVKAFA